MSAAEAHVSSRRGTVPKVLRYGAGSVVAAICSEVTFLLLYGVAGAGTTVASVLGWLAGALPNYWMNRSWAWGRRGRPSLRHEVMPYVAIVLVTLVLAVVATGAASAALEATTLSSTTRTLLVGGVFLLVYVLVFIVRFFLFDALFSTPHAGAAPLGSSPDPEGIVTLPTSDQPADEDSRTSGVVSPEERLDTSEAAADGSPAHRGGSGAFSQATGRSLEDSSGRHQRRYRAFQFGLIAEHCGPSVLEVGAGLGEFASQFEGLERLVVTDVDPDAVAAMGERFEKRLEVEARQLDLGGHVEPVGDPVSTVVAVNVLEHLEDDSGALRSLATLVEPGGSIVLWVPGYMQLYGDFDRAVGHVRRYTPHTLREAVEGAGLTCAEVRPVNMLGAVAWWVAVRRGGVKGPNPWMHRIYDTLLVPPTRLLERWLRPPFGQSVLAVASVPDPSRPA